MPRRRWRSGASRFPLGPRARWHTRCPGSSAPRSSLCPRPGRRARDAGCSSRGSPALRATRSTGTASSSSWNSSSRRSGARTRTCRGLRSGKERLCGCRCRCAARGPGCCVLSALPSVPGVALAGLEGPEAWNARCVCLSEGEGHQPSSVQEGRGPPSWSAPAGGAPGVPGASPSLPPERRAVQWWLCLYFGVLPNGTRDCGRTGFRICSLELCSRGETQTSGVTPIPPLLPNFQFLELKPLGTELNLLITYVSPIFKASFVSRTAIPP